MKTNSWVCINCIPCCWVSGKEKPKTCFGNECNKSNYCTKDTHWIKSICLPVRCPDEERKIKVYLWDIYTDITNEV
ncbi:MAG: hypothetical protein M0R51_08210 [Clostridia bacterium]|jgi:hypothetical protein|nr:hypothetical protein [Clostridia bacterium]